MARFNSTQHVEQFAQGRGYPKIHDNIFNLIAETWRGGSFVDVCCSTGLLGQRLIDKLGVMCVGVEGDLEAIGNGKQHGIHMSLHHVLLDVDTLGLFSRILDMHQVNTVVMRRCVSELFAKGMPLGVGNTVQTELKADFAVKFVDTLLGAGVNEIYLQGRAESVSSKHVIPNVDAEIKFFLPHYSVIAKRGQCAYLRRTNQAEAMAA